MAWLCRVKLVFEVQAGLCYCVVSIITHGYEYWRRLKRFRRLFIRILAVFIIIIVRVCDYFVRWIRFLPKFFGVLFVNMATNISVVYNESHTFYWSFLTEFLGIWCDFSFVWYDLWCICLDVMRRLYKINTVMNSGIGCKDSDALFLKKSLP